MSADNCLAILETHDGQFRVADIHMIWLNDANRLERLLACAEQFNLSPVFTNEKLLDDYIDMQLDRADKDGRYIEYGTETYSIEMSFPEFYSMAHQKGLWHPIFGTCELCHVHSKCRRFEECVVCISCFQVIQG